ncbi:hypothetical protein CPIN18021_0224 [Campylobacter pinnipediorum subsp. caledonicus]|uniref:Uncharacterized protein n=1 Tax=Campylobacter pinnipediorum subsp. caledonicus TaxID=1874362 RepID=A0A1S6U5R0_9BACT|nr:hypothetical protein CPIN18021_0224 [Campylobacter pinnipediorum subsp. caledonicus]
MKQSKEFIILILNSKKIFFYNPALNKISIIIKHLNYRVAKHILALTSKIYNHICSKF